ncbi:unnamed protein product [Adineta steineri]|uniref:FAM194 C-terminal domain-containing protein n=2 Tax=Adineta steineri TaxID=433720 RepID=A0A818Z046_9BILA|nr:unnamed protein product [Adineta steineri]
MPFSSNDIDLFFDVLHQTNLRWSQKSASRHPMSRGLYFHDQFGRVSHIGGIHRYKRDSDDFTQALQQVKIALAAKDDKPAKLDSFADSPTPQNKQNLSKEADGLLKNIQRKLKAPIVPDVLCRDLDTLLQRFDEKNKISLTSSSMKIAPKSDQLLPPEGEQEIAETVSVQESMDDDKSKISPLTPPKIVLPDAVIIGLHSTWGDLIENTEDNYKVWRTKAAEETWARRMERKRKEHLKAERHGATAINITIIQPRKSSRPSVTSTSTASHQPPPSAQSNLRIRSNRSLSRVSFLSASQENTRLLKPLHHAGPEGPAGGLHVEFKLSTESDDNKQQTTTDKKAVTFDVKKPMVDLYEDMIALIQIKCKRLLVEMKQKISKTNGYTSIHHPKMCKVWFYEDIRHLRNKTNLLSLNEIARKQKMKFIFSLLRKQIPEKYTIDIEIPKAKHKCYIELIDGSIQIYYPSGRIAVLCLQPPNPSTLFFDDTDIPENQFLGLVTSTGSVLIMQPSLHARFVTDNQHERGFLCNGETGLIEKQLRSHSNESGTDAIVSNQTTGNDDEGVFAQPADSTVQLQLNPYMQLEYYNPINIRFAFSCHKEEFKFQLGADPATQIQNSTETTIASTKKNSADRRRQSKSKLSTIVSSSTHSSELSLNSERPQILPEKLPDGQVNIKELPMMKELTNIKKRFKTLCNNWLKECRTALGVTEAYSSNRFNISNMKFNQLRGVKSPRHVSMSSKRDSVNSEFLQPGEKEDIVRTNSARKSDPDIIESTMMEFTPRSEHGKAMKQKYNAKRFMPSTVLPAINEAASSMSLDLPFACPTLIRQRLLQDNPISTILYDACTCRADQVPLIHDLEFDAFISLTNQLNSRQLVVIGITNSNNRHFEKEQTNELYEILQSLHYHLYSGRSQLCSCRLSTNDDYRCLIYDLAQASKQSHSQGPLLVRRHHVQPGFVLIYQNGRLIFGDSIFNGYGTNVHDLQNQLNRMRQQQIALPEEFKFISDQRRPNTTILKSI